MGLRSAPLGGAEPTEGEADGGGTQRPRAGGGAPVYRSLVTSSWLECNAASAMQARDRPLTKAYVKKSLKHQLKHTSKRK